MPEMVSERYDIQNTIREITFNFSASHSTELIFQLFKYDFSICIFVIDRILSAHYIFKTVVMKKNTEAIISLAMENMKCHFIPLDRAMFENIFEFFFTVKFVYNRTVSLNVMIVAHLPCIFRYPGFKIWPRYELSCLRFFFVYFLNYGKLVLRFYLIQDHIIIQSVLCTCSLHSPSRVRHV
jgi:hypothetical protein